jgi:hypothetical protein
MLHGMIETRVERILYAQQSNSDGVHAHYRWRLNAWSVVVMVRIDAYKMRSTRVSGVSIKICNQTNS